jgi:DNA-binding NarL/FixJ family response regulator
MSAVALPHVTEHPGEPLPAREGSGCGSKIRVSIAGVHSPALIGVRSMLVGVRGILVMPESEEESSSRSAPGDADVIIVELANSDVPVRTAIRELVLAFGTTHLLIMSARRDVEWILAALDAGAAGVVHANASRDALVVAVRAIASGQLVLPRRAISALNARAREEMELGDAHASGLATDTERAIGRLTGRERSVFRMIAQGYSAPEVGTRLSISKKTVETYKRRISEKLGFSHRTDYVRLAMMSDMLVAPHVATAE